MIDIKNKIFNNKKLLLVTNIIFILTIIILIIAVSSRKDNNNISITHDEDNSFLLTNPILDCESSNQNSNSVIFSDNVSEKVDQLKNKYQLTNISLYFRDLNNGPWVGINEKEVFSPASLLKVPLLISFLHEAESDKSILDKKVLISPNDINQSIHQNIKGGDVLSVGKEYSMSEIAEFMIEKSDNTAVLALLRNINQNRIGNVFRTVGVPYKDISNEVNVSVKNYAGFFRVLYNSSYLNREMSEKALEIMTKSEYNDGVVAGVPKGIVVAHKFGERSIDNLTNSTQLHDCGIVYYPGKPYIICIMTHGSDFRNQTKVIQELSSYVYNEVDKNKNNL